MHIIPNTINFIWLGSLLSLPHQDNLKRWRTVNQNFAINIWIKGDILSPADCREFKQFCLLNNLILRDVTELTDISPNVLRFLNSSFEYTNPNYGALSDIYRFYILRDGGWYFDTDVSPVNSLPLDLLTQYGFLINCDLRHGGVFVSPDQIAVSPKSMFAKMNIKVIENMISISHFIELIHKKNPIECYTCTEATTGLIAMLTCTKLFINENLPLVLIGPKLFIAQDIKISYVLGNGVFFVVEEREVSWMMSRFKEGEKKELYTDKDLQQKTQELFFRANLSLEKQFVDENIQISIETRPYNTTLLPETIQLGASSAVEELLKPVGESTNKSEISHQDLSLNCLSASVKDPSIEQQEIAEIQVRSEEESNQSITPTADLDKDVMHINPGELLTIYRNAKAFLMFKENVEGVVNDIRQVVLGYLHYFN